MPRSDCSRLRCRWLAKHPVLLLCIGSDLAMMEALNDYRRPFHQRATEMVIPPLGPADVAAMLDLSAAEAFDAYLVSGGLPLVLDEWPRGASLWDYLAEATDDPTSALLVSGERSLAAEFPAEANARRVLGAIGSGERAFTLISRAAGDMPRATLTRALHLLTTKRVVDAATPFKRSWTSWRGRAIEPVVRESLRRVVDGPIPEGTGAIGGYWTRTNDPEIDIVGADRAPVGERITVVGSIKWLESRPFDEHDLAELVVHRSRLPGADDSTPLLAVARSGGDCGPVAVITPDELLTAW